MPVSLGDRRRSVQEANVGINTNLLRSEYIIIRIRNRVKKLNILHT